MAIFYFGSLERDRVLRPYVANWICLFGWGFHFFCLPRDKVKFQCKNETSPWPVQNSFSYILIDINGCDILKGEKITHIPSSPRRLRASWSLFFFFFFWTHTYWAPTVYCVSGSIWAPALLSQRQPGEPSTHTREGFRGKGYLVRHSEKLYKLALVFFTS